MTGCADEPAEPPCRDDAPLGRASPSPGRLVRPVPVDPTGAQGPTRGQAAGPRWRRTSHGLIVPSQTSTDLVEQRILEQSMRLPAYGAVTGWAALRLVGAGLVDGLAPDGRSPLPVPLIVGPHGRLRPTPGALPVHCALPATERAVRHGVPCVVAERAAYDATWLAEDLREAVVAVDMAMAAGLVTLPQMWAYADSRRPRSGWVERALSLASPRSRSPQETRLRLIWHLDAKLPLPLVNASVRDLAGHLLGIVDLLDVEACLAVEFDGADHREARRHTDDVTREDDLRDVGLEVAHVTGLQLHDRTQAAARLEAARRRAPFTPREERLWVVDSQGRLPNA